MNATPDPAWIEQVLAERARALARPETPAPSSEVLSLVVLALGAERYGLELQWVREVQPLAGLTRVPGLPPYWAGLINVRGQLYPVLDLQPYLSLPPRGAPVAGRKVVIVAADPQWQAEAGSTPVAVLADDVLDLRHLPLAELGPPLAGGARREAQRLCIRGVTADLLTVLDLPALLADPALIIDAPTL